MSYKMIEEEQSKLAFKFIKLLFSDDVEGLWETISKVDQARVYGMYRECKNQEEFEGVSFFSYIRDWIKPGVEQLYEGLQENPGIATFQRYTDKGEVLIYMLKDIKTSITYIADSPEKAFPIAMNVDANYYKGEIKVEWKIRLYHDQDYKYLK